MNTNRINISQVIGNRSCQYQFSVKYHNSKLLTIILVRVS